MLVVNISAHHRHVPICMCIWTILTLAQNTAHHVHITCFWPGYWPRDSCADIDTTPEYMSRWWHIWVACVDQSLTKRLVIQFQKGCTELHVKESAESSPSSSSVVTSWRTLWRWGKNQRITKLGNHHLGTINVCFCADPFGRCPAFTYFMTTLSYWWH